MVRWFSQLIVLLARNFLTNTRASAFCSVQKHVSMFPARERLRFYSWRLRVSESIRLGTSAGSQTGNGSQYTRWRSAAPWTPCVPAMLSQHYWGSPSAEMSDTNQPIVRAPSACSWPPRRLKFGVRPARIPPLVILRVASRRSSDGRVHRRGPTRPTQRASSIARSGGNLASFA